MKVYIVTSGSYSDYTIQEVFTNKKQAEIYCAVSNYQDMHIETWECDAVHFETDEEPLRLWSMPFSLYARERNENVCDCGLTMKEKRSVELGRNSYIAYITTEKECEEEKAKKIMRDYISEWKYNWFIEQANKAKGE
jgi:hypothetical protein